MNARKNPLADASAADAATQFVEQHKKQAIAQAERRYRLSPGALIGPSWEAAYGHAEAGTLTADPTSVIQSAVYAAVRAIEEPVSRGHGSAHSYSVALESVAEVGDTDAPDLVLEAEQAVAKREAEDEWSRREMREAQRLDKTVGSDYKGAPGCLRSAERRKAELRAAREAGQMEFAGGRRPKAWGNGCEIAIPEPEPRKRGLIGRIVDRIARQMALPLDSASASEPPKPTVTHGWHPQPHNGAVLAGGAA